MDYRQQLEQLWQYQIVDLEIDKMENVLRNSTLRKRLSKAVSCLKDSQSAIARMEGEAQEITHKLEIVSRDCEQSAAEYGQITQEDMEGMTREQLNLVRQKSGQWADIMARREREIADLCEQLKKQMKQLEEMRVQVARAKKEYPSLKEEYEKEAAKLADETAPLKEKRDAVGDGIDKDLLARYKKIKGRRPNPVAKIVSAQCAGCNMEIAQYVLSRAKTTGSVVECENCGRILFLED